MEAECQICGNMKSLEDFAYLANCICMYCRECTKGYISSRIDDNYTDMPCMNTACKLPIEYNDVMTLVINDDREKYTFLLLRKALLSMPEYKLCPNSGCPGFIEKYSSNNGACQICKNKYCFKCLNKPHDEVSCEIYIKELANLDEDDPDYLTKKWQIGKNIKTCPKCSWPIHKYEGCNRMICTKCNTCFCWLCKKVLDKDNSYEHFDRGRCDTYATEMAEQVSEESDDNDNDDDVDMNISESESDSNTNSDDQMPVTVSE